MTDLRQLLVTGNGGFGMVLTGNAPTVVTSVDPGSPADKGGIEIGDVLVQLDGVDAAMMTHTQVIEYLRPFVRTTMLFGVIKLAPLQLDTYRERIRQLVQQRQLVRRWSASSMRSGASLIPSLDDPASPLSLPVSPSSAGAGDYGRYDDEPEEMTSRPVAKGHVAGGGASLPVSTKAQSWPRQGSITKSQLISMSLMDDVGDEESRAEQQRAEDLAALGLLSSNQAPQANGTAAKAVPASKRGSGGVAPRAVAQTNGHGSASAAASKSPAAMKTQPQAASAQERAATGVKGKGDQGHSSTPATAPWLEEPVSAPATQSAPQEASWEERIRALPASEQKKAAARTKSFGKRFAAAQAVYDSHATLAHMAVEAKLKKSDQAKFDKLADQIEEMEKKSIPCPVTISVGGREGAYSFVNCTLRRLLFLDGRPIYASKGTVALQHGAYGGQRLYLFFDESHAAWVLNTDPAATGSEVLAFSPDGATKPDMLRKPWYFHADGDRYTLDEAVKLRRGGSRKRVSFSRDNSTKRIQHDGSLSDSQPDLLAVSGDASDGETMSPAGGAEDDTSVFEEDQAGRGATREDKAQAPSASEASSARSASRVLTLNSNDDNDDDDDNDNHESQGETSTDGAAAAVAEKKASATPPKPARAKNEVAADRPRAASSSAHARPTAANGQNGSVAATGRRWSTGGSSSTSPTGPVSYPRFEGLSTTKEPEDTFTLDGDAAASGSASKRASVASSDDPFAYLSMSSSSAAAADDSNHKKRRGSFGRKKKESKAKAAKATKAASPVSPASPVSATAIAQPAAPLDANDPFAYLTSGRSGSVSSSRGGSDRRKKK